MCPPDPKAPGVPLSLSLTPVSDDRSLDQLLLFLGGSTQENCNHRENTDAATQSNSEARAALRESLRGVTTRASSKCGRVGAMGKVAEIWVEEDQQGARTARTKGPLFCRSPHACPVCTPRLRAKAAKKLRRAVSAARARGLLVFMLTLTLRHSADDRLDFLIRLLTRAWRFLNGGADWRPLRGKGGLVGSVRALDITHGGAGWHPHLHVLLVVQPDAPKSKFGTDASLACTATAISEAWVRSLKHALVDLDLEPAEWPRYLPQPTHGVSLEVAAGTGDYLVKSAEARAGGGAGGRTVWDIMESAAAGDERDRELWKDYSQAILRQRLLPGFDRLQKVLGIFDEKDKQEPREQDPGPGAHVADIPKKIYNKLEARAGAIRRLERGAVEGGLQGVATAVVRELHPELVAPSDAFWSRVRVYMEEFRPTPVPFARDVRCDVSQARDPRGRGATGSDPDGQAPIEAHEDPSMQTAGNNSGRSRQARIALGLYRRRAGRRSAQGAQAPGFSEPGVSAAHRRRVRWTRLRKMVVLGRRQRQRQHLGPHACASSMVPGAHTGASDRGAVRRQTSYRYAAARERLP
ncbi:MAG: hypothetical protein ABS52_05960 [Gemmatimonadetes bacterium SCN 70-22]|nr:MAG: hypothetical protein ABS52_05960 [Gemmatimonadetes bacterium SCN 70-22]